MKSDDKLMKMVNEAEALAHLLRAKADEILSHCCKIKRETEGVSTPSNDLEHEILKQHVLAKRQARLVRKMNNSK